MWFLYTIPKFYFLWLSMNKQTRKDVLQLRIEPMARTGLHEQCSNHWAIEAQSSHIVFFSEWYLIIESIWHRYDVYEAHGYSEGISNQVKMMVNSSPFIQGKYDYLKERKGAYVIFIYNTKILLSLTFDEQTDKKRCASTENRTHDQDWFTWTML